jgi:predicted RNA-binding Zn-ribbon protein involved in translation (DUF1610 family)
MTEPKKETARTLQYGCPFCGKQLTQEHWGPGTTLQCICPRCGEAVTGRVVTRINPIYKEEELGFEDRTWWRKKRAANE